MIALAITAVQLLTITPPSGEPTVSADVGPAWISRGSIAEGLERADFFLRIPEGGATRLWVIVPCEREARSVMTGGGHVEVLKILGKSD
jgi:hypothetical protein